MGHFLEHRKYLWVTHPLTYCPSDELPLSRDTVQVKSSRASFLEKVDFELFAQGVGLWVIRHKDDCNPVVWDEA